MLADPMARALWLSAAAIALLHAGSMPLASNDLHIYLAMGRQMAELGGLADTEVFSFTAQGTPFVNGTWGWSRLSWALYEAGGLDAIRLAKGLAVGLAVAGTALASRAWGASERASAVAALYAWALMLQNVAARGQTFVYVLFVAALWLGAPRGPLDRRRGALLAAGGLLLGATWGPLHGSFPAGVVALGALSLGQLLHGRPWGAPALVGAGLALGPLLGPYGPELYRYILSNGSLPEARGFAEWLPPTLDSFEGARLYLALATWLALFAAGPRRLSWGGALTVLGFGFLAMGATRFVSWFGLATAPALALRLSAALPDRPATPLGRRLAWATLGVWALLLPLGLQPPERALDPETPIAAVEAIGQDAREGRVLLPPAWAGYLIFELYPRFLVSSDVRTWIYDDAAWAFYVELSRAPGGWEQRLDAAGVTHLLLTERAHGDTLLPAARASTRWRLLHEDEAGAAFARAALGR
ncbi:MAG: hypothetical protein H6741_07675 [Alphaproteobacteria bacterium]|nr:hypothetical protein [Alphaproteobacteria bacterium]